jgi:hypothetical protein
MDVRVDPRSLWCANWSLVFGPTVRLETRRAASQNTPSSMATQWRRHPSTGLGGHGEVPVGPIGCRCGSWISLAEECPPLLAEEPATSCGGTRPAGRPGASAAPLACGERGIQRRRTEAAARASLGRVEFCRVWRMSVLSRPWTWRVMWLLSARIPLVLLFFLAEFVAEPKRRTAKSGLVSCSYQRGLSRLRTTPRSRNAELKRPTMVRGR